MKRKRAGRILPPDAGSESSEQASAGALVTGPDAAVTHNVSTVSRFEHGELRRRSLVERLSDAIAAAAGSTVSLVAHAVFFGSWLWVNTIGILDVRAFDPFPYGLLTTIVSL